MRREDKRITDPAAIEAILDRAPYCTVALCDGEQPYAVPMNFAVAAGILYLHAAPEGMKIDCLRRNNRLCFNAVIREELVASALPCDWGMRYRSVTGYGRASFVTDPEEKRAALTIIMRKYAGLQEVEFSDARIAAVAVIRVALSRLDAKQSGP